MARARRPAPPPHSPLALLALLLATAFAGCIGDSGGSARVSFDGTGNGAHEDEEDCDSDATLYASGQVEEGQVDVHVTDGDARTVFRRQFDGGANLDAQALSGASGTWSLSAIRSSDSLLGSPFRGAYSFRLAC